MAALIVLCLTVTVTALTGSPARPTVFRTDPVLRALSASAQGPEAELADLAAVPSLSVSAHFVLPPLPRADVKRVLEPAPSPPTLAAMPNVLAPLGRVCDGVAAWPDAPIWRGWDAST
jgi:hypothetical protein